MKNPIHDLTALGQSLWYDNIQRQLLENGELAAMIDRGDIRGVTSNPTIFHNAIAKSHDYDSALTPLACPVGMRSRFSGSLPLKIFARPVTCSNRFITETDCADGYVSLEVSPYLANDTAGTVAQAKNLWQTVNRPNLMIKIPGHQSWDSGCPPGDCRGNQRQCHADFLHRALQGSHGRLSERPGRLPAGGR